MNVFIFIVGYYLGAFILGLIAHARIYMRYAIAAIAFSLFGNPPWWTILILIPAIFAWANAREKVGKNPQREISEVFLLVFNIFVSKKERIRQQCQSAIAQIPNLILQLQAELNSKGLENAIAISQNDIEIVYSLNTDENDILRCAGAIYIRLQCAIAIHDFYFGIEREVASSVYWQQYEQVTNWMNENL